MMTKKYITDVDLEKNLEEIVEGEKVSRLDEKCSVCEGLLIVHRGLYTCLRRKKEDKDEIKADSEQLYKEIIEKLPKVMEKVGKKRKEIDQNRKDNEEHAQKDVEKKLLD